MTHASEFGGRHTLDKLRILEFYLPAYTTALKKTSFRLHYVDAFAGSGLCRINIAERPLLVPGSARIALACEPPFHRLTFIERNRRHAAALRRLAEATPGRDIAILNEDANQALPRVLEALYADEDRAVVFLDPFGMSVEWRTLERIAQSELVDLWYLFPLSGLYRQAATTLEAIDRDKAAAITRLLGTDDWREAFGYRTSPQISLFGDKDDQRYRGVSASQMLEWVSTRMRTIFPGVAEPAVLRQQLPSGKHGAPLFALYFAVSNPSPKAVSLALKIARDILRG